MNDTTRLWLLRGALAIATFGLLPLARAQQWEAGINIGASTYTGELSPVRVTQQMQALGFSYGAHVRYAPLEWLALRLNYQDLDIFGDDAERASSQERNLRFYTDIDELALVVEVYPFRTTAPVSPYLAFGGSAFRFNPITYLGDDAIALQPLGTEGQGLPGFEPRYKLTEYALPLGGGLRIKMSERWVINLEALGRITFTDYIDDVSGVYVAEDVLQANGPTAVALAYRGDELPDAEPGSRAPAGDLRGNPVTEDFYYTFTAGVAFRFGWSGGRRGAGANARRTVKCPKF